MNTTLKVTVGVGIGALMAVILLMYAFISGQSHRVSASVDDGQGYNHVALSGQIPLSASGILKAGPGMLGSFVITGATTGIVEFYDATTSNVSLRAASMSTSSITVASFPASTGAGTYTLDATLANGLVTYVSGTAPTSTVTYK